METIGSFQTLMHVDNISLNIIFHVVREQDIQFAGMIGKAILKDVDIILTEEEVLFKKKDSTDKQLVKYNNQEIDIKRGNSGKSDSKREWINEFDLMNLTEIKYEQQLNLEHLEKGLAKEIEGLVHAYAPVGSCPSPVKMQIVLSDEIPVYQRPRRMSFEDQRFVNKQIEEWLQEGIIQPSSSNYASPIVVVPKKDGNKRLCCDYRQLNQKIMRDNFPMVLMDDVLDKLQEGRVFTTLDLYNGFFHVPVESQSMKYTAFVSSSGQYEFCFVPFGISNSPAVFCRYINAVFRTLIQKGTVITYMDDLIIPSKDEDEGLEKLKEVLRVCTTNGLKIKWSKCQFLRRTVEFLGYIIESGTIQISEEKTAAVRNFPLPSDKKTLQRFLGLTSYFRRFIANFAVIARPLSNLLRKDAVFKLGEEQIAAFMQLKKLLQKAPVLRLFSENAVTEVHADASKYGYGAMLLQKDPDDQELHPVQYMSRKTKPVEENYPAYELEVLAIIEALKKWRIYLLGIKFKIVTDCNAFTMTLKRKDVPPKIARWALFLQDFNYEIEHRAGTRMAHVDALSRVYCLMLEDSLKYRLKQAQLKDEWTKAVRKILEKDEYDDFYLKYDILFKNPEKELIVVPVLMEEEVIKMAHRQGHFSTKKTQDLLEKTFYIPHVSSKVGKVVQSCIECIVNESKSGKKEGFLNTINKEDKPLSTYHIDHVGPLETTSKSYNYILVVVDAFSKFVWLYPTRNTGAEAVVDRLQKQAAVFGNPNRIITDRGAAFTSNIFKEYCEGERIQHLLITTGVPRGNGQVERIHKVVIPMLSKLCTETPSNWYKHIDKVQKFINNTPPRSTKQSPFKILTGLDMRTANMPELQDLLENAAVDELHEDREVIRQQAKENITKIQEENRRTYNLRRRQETNYKLNELVAVKRTQFGSGLKLKPKFLGPYKITKQLNHGRYEVEKVGDHEGPGKTSTVAEYMKKWTGSFEGE